MADKELIRQEIERRIKNLEFSLENNCVEKYSKLDILGNITTLESLLQFIDSLPEEPYKPNYCHHEVDLSDCSEEYRKAYYDGWNNCNIQHDLLKNEQFDYHNATIITKDFSGKRKEESTSKDLEKASIEYSCANPSERSNGMYDQTDIEWAFEAGAEWQQKKDQETIELAEDHAMLAGMNKMKEEMMKDAVDATIFSELKSSDGSLFQAKTDRFRMNGVKISDRIKVIPIKTEQQ